MAPAPSRADCLELDGRARADVDGALDVGLRAPDVPSAADLEAAAPIAAQARATFDAEGPEAALADLRRAWQLSADVDLLGRLGLALHAAGEHQAAWIALRRFGAEASADARAELEGRVRTALEALRARLGVVRLRAPVARGQVFVAGQLAGTLPLEEPLYLAPGRAHLEVRAEGRLARELDVDVELGGEVEVDVDLDAPDPNLRAGADVDADLDASVDADAPSAGGGFDPWPWIGLAGAVTGVLVIGGVVATVVADGLTGDLGSLDCDAMPALCEGVQADMAVAEAFELVGYIGAGLGATAAIVVGIVAAVVGGAASDADVDADTDADIDGDCDARERDRARIEVSCGPWLGETMGGACRLSF